MLCLRKETDYALQMLTYLKKVKGKIVSLSAIAKETGVSFLFLQKIARKLRLAGIIKAEQGVEGGYKLNKIAEKMSILKIVEAMEGKCGLLTCLKSNRCLCKKEKNCHLKKKMATVNAKMVKILEKITLKDI